MNLSKDKRPALILVDIQKAFDDVEFWGGDRNNMNAEKNSSRILNLWRQKKLPLYHIQHCSVVQGSPLAPNMPGNEIKDEVKPGKGEPLIQKTTNSAFIGTDLKERLDAERISQVVIIGLTTDHCVSTTTRMAGNYGFDTYLVEDAVATFCKKGINGELYSAQQVHDINIASLNDEFATVVSTEDLLALINP